VSVLRETTGEVDVTTVFNPVNSLNKHYNSIILTAKARPSSRSEERSNMERGVYPFNTTLRMKSQSDILVVLLKIIDITVATGMSVP